MATPPARSRSRQAAPDPASPRRRLEMSAGSPCFSVQSSSSFFSRVPAWQRRSIRHEQQIATGYGPMFDSSLIMLLAAMRGEGLALAPYGLFRREIDSGQIVRPFAIEIDVDGYW